MNKKQKTFKPKYLNKGKKDCVNKHNYKALNEFEYIENILNKNK